VAYNTLPGMFSSLLKEYKEYQKELKHKFGIQNTEHRTRNGTANGGRAKPGSGRPASRQAYGFPKREARAAQLFRIPCSVF
jgi:hypothetical protein